MLQQSVATAPYLARGVSPHHRPSWPWTWHSSSRPSGSHAATAPWTLGHSSWLPPLASSGLLLCCRSLALWATAPDLGLGITPFGCRPWPRTWSSSSWPALCASSQPPTLCYSPGGSKRAGHDWKPSLLLSFTSAEQLRKCASISRHLREALKAESGVGGAEDPIESFLVTLSGNYFLLEISQSRSR